MPRQPTFFNTFGRQLQPLKPLEPGRVKIYTCGPTVYNFAHIGNLRTFLFEDVLRRALKYLGYEVNQVMNLTDVDDKIIRGAQEAGVGLEEFTEPYIKAFFEDLDILNMERAEVYPKATEHVPEMIALTETLVEKGYAYQAEDGSVFFRIAQDEDYGKLSGFDLQQVRQGERVASDEYDKEDARDFVLWKGTKPGEASWDSPWGEGRPGWHLECSAMSQRYLGKTFDIHCGGVDNIFPHHENEIAQSESANGVPFAGLWMHSEHLIVEGEKMSKSLGNFYTLRQLLERGEDPRAIRYLFLSVHYRQKLNFTFESLKAAGAALRRLDEMRFRLDHAQEDGPGAEEVTDALEALELGFGASLADDLNMSEALAHLFVFVKEVNRLIEASRLGDGDRQRIQASLTEIDQVLGCIDPSPWEVVSEGGSSDDEIQALVEARTQARSDRDFAEADRLRDKLTELGIVLEDTPQGPRWRRQ